MRLLSISPSSKRKQESAGGYLKGEEEVIGSCGFLNWVSKHFRSVIGFELSKEKWGQGIAGEALEAVIKYGFEQMNLQRIEALIEPPNLASQKLVERHG